jgi:hypothetical protein
VADSLVPQSKRCHRCELEQPLERFDRDATKPDGYRSVCKSCRCHIAEAKRLEQAADMLKALDLGLVRALANSKPGGTDVPHLAEIYQSIIHLLGGVQGLAQQYVATYIASKPGSQTRERLLGQVVKMGEVVSDSKKVEMPVELMSDQDLEREIENRAKRLNIVPGEATEVETSLGPLPMPPMEDLDN